MFVRIKKSSGLQNLKLEELVSGKEKKILLKDFCMQILCIFQLKGLDN